MRIEDIIKSNVTMEDVKREIKIMMDESNLKLQDCIVDPKHDDLPSNLNFLT
jgi:hypothetical protein